MEKETSPGSRKTFKFLKHPENVGGRRPQPSQGDLNGRLQIRDIEKNDQNIRSVKMPKNPLPHHGERSYSLLGEFA